MKQIRKSLELRFIGFLALKKANILSVVI